MANQTRNRHGWRCLAERKLRLRVRQYGERYRWFESISLRHAVPTNRGGFRVDRNPRNSGGLVRRVVVCEPIPTLLPHSATEITRQSQPASSTPRASSTKLCLLGGSLRRLCGARRGLRTCRRGHTWDDRVRQKQVTGPDWGRSALADSRRNLGWFGYGRRQAGSRRPGDSGSAGGSAPIRERRRGAFGRLPGEIHELPGRRQRRCEAGGRPSSRLPSIRSTSRPTPSRTRSCSTLSTRPNGAATFPTDSSNAVLSCRGARCCRLRASLFQNGDPGQNFGFPFVARAFLVCVPPPLPLRSGWEIVRRCRTSTVTMSNSELFSLRPPHIGLLGAMLLFA